MLQNKLRKTIERAEICPQQREMHFTTVKSLINSLKKVPLRNRNEKTTGRSQQLDFLRLWKNKTFLKYVTCFV